MKSKAHPTKFRKNKQKRFNIIVSKYLISLIYLFVKQLDVHSNRSRRESQDRHCEYQHQERESQERERQKRERRNRQSREY